MQNTKYISMQLCLDNIFKTPEAKFPLFVLDALFVLIPILVFYEQHKKGPPKRRALNKSGLVLLIGCVYLVLKNLVSSFRFSDWLTNSSALEASSSDAAAFCCDKSFS